LIPDDDSTSPAFAPIFHFDATEDERNENRSEDKRRAEQFFPHRGQCGDGLTRASSSVVRPDLGPTWDLQFQVQLMFPK
jgi:hypothetical protein